jgi:hypothetical protein
MRAAPLGGAPDRCKNGGGPWALAAAPTTLVQFIEVVSYGFAGGDLKSLGTGTVFEVKCLLAIDAIAAVYGAG